MTDNVLASEVCDYINADISDAMNSGNVVEATRLNNMLEYFFAVSRSVTIDSQIRDTK